MLARQDAPLLPNSAALPGCACGIPLRSVEATESALGLLPSRPILRSVRADYNRGQAQDATVVVGTGIWHFSLGQTEVGFCWFTEPTTVFVTLAQRLPLTRGRGE